MQFPYLLSLTNPNGLRLIAWKLIVIRFLFCVCIIDADAHFSQCMEEAGVDGALSVQPINHKFDHSVMSQRMFNNFSTHLM